MCALSRVQKGTRGLTHKGWHILSDVTDVFGMRPNTVLVHFRTVVPYEVREAGSFSLPGSLPARSRRVVENRMHFYIKNKISIYVVQFLVLFENV